MYIKLSCSEFFANVPHCWAGLILSLTHQPELIERLPAGITSGKAVNKTVNLNSDHHPTFTPHNYDYYLFCKFHSREAIKTAIENFREKYQHKLPSIVVNDRYPNHNPFVEELNEYLQNPCKIHSHLHHILLSAKNILTREKDKENKYFKPYDIIRRAP